MNTMKRKVLYSVVMLLVTMAAQAQKISINDMSVTANDMATIDISLEDGSAFTASGFSIVLPTGISFMEKVSEEGERKHSSHQVRTYTNNDNVTKVAVYSLQNSSLPENGSLMKFRVKADGNIGTFKGEIRGIEFSSLTEGLISKPDITFNISVMNNTEGIIEVEANGSGQPQRIFNLAGQRLYKPQRGVNIINGRRVICK